jgi:hypothetical protein
LLHELGRAVKCIEQRLASGNNRVDHQLMTALGEYCLHLITQHVMEEGHECAGACVHDDVGLGRLAGDLFNEPSEVALISNHTLGSGDLLDSRLGTVS